MVNTRLVRRSNLPPPPVGIAAPGPPPDDPSGTDPSASSDDDSVSNLDPDSVLLPAVVAPAVPPPAPDLLQINQALQALTQVVTLLATNQQNLPIIPPLVPPPAHAPVIDLFDDLAPFDLSSRAGQFAYSKASAILDVTWDGANSSSFHNLVVALLTRSAECKFDAPSPYGIVDVPTSPGTTANIFLDFSDITTAHCTAARLARTAHPRAKQNAAALYDCLKLSITGSLHSLLFEQFADRPTHGDGIALFKRLTDFASTSSFELSNQAIYQLTTFAPSQFDFNIPKINLQLSVLFFQAKRSLVTESQKIHHTLKVYEKIKQPDKWSTFVCNSLDEYENQTLTDCQFFHNKAVKKYNAICLSNGGLFGGSSNSHTDDFVAMKAAFQKTIAVSSNPSNKRLPGVSYPPRNPSSSKKPRVPFIPFERPPFHQHTTKGGATGSTAVPYKVGDTRDWNDNTYHFCDATTHKDQSHWHKHRTADCSIRAKFLANRSSTTSTNAPAAHAHFGTSVHTEVLNNPSATFGSPPITGSDSSIKSSHGHGDLAMLSIAMNRQTNPLVKEFLARALLELEDST